MVQVGLGVRSDSVVKQQSEEPETNDAAAFAAASTPCPLGWWRITLLILLLNTTLFFHGCENGDFRYSAGFVPPFLEVAVENSRTWPSHVVDASISSFLAGVLLAVSILWLIRRRCPRLARGLASRTFFGALSISVALLNSFLISPRVWSYVAWWPTMYFISLCEWFLPVQADGPVDSKGLDIVVGSRLYFVSLLSVLYLSLRLGAYVLNRFFLITPKRWWQFQLGGLMGLTVFLGTVIGLVVRILLQVR
jgi:hypothetical protein